MNSYYYVKVDRRDFGNLISEEGMLNLNVKKVVGTAVLSEPKNNSVLAIWTTDPKTLPQLPQVLICEDGTLDDWAAWITTFAARVRPFSAYTRLMTLADFESSMNSRPKPDVGIFAWPMTGLILGEVLASGLTDKALDSLPASAFASTLSFTMFRTAILYPDFNHWPQLLDMWNSVREVTNQRTRSVDCGLVARVCATALTAFDFSGASGSFIQIDAEVSDACRYLFMSPGNIPLQTSEINYVIFDKILRGSREDRVRAFDEFVSKITNISNQKPELVALMLGYLASRIAPGTIKHSSVLAQVSNRYPGALLWYGFWSGIGEFEADIKSSIRKRSLEFPLCARRIIRELFRPQNILETPVCDIGYLELIALSRTGGDFLESMIKTSQGSITVELVPSVCTAVSYISNQPARSQSREMQQQSQDVPQREALAAIGEQIERLREMYKSLLGVDQALKGRAQSSEQGSLFSTRRKKKYPNKLNS